MALAIFSVLLFSVAQAASPRKVFLVAGQSNADGRAPITSMPQYVQDYVSKGGSPYCQWSYCNGIDATWNKYAGKFTAYVPYGDNSTSNRVGFDAIVYHLLDEALKERYYVIKQSRGGTAIDPRCSSTGNLWWCCDSAWLSTASPRSGHSLALEFTQNIGLCIDNVLSKLQQGYEIECILWHQGESDRTQAASYMANLRQLVAYLRQYLVDKTGDNRYKTLPFIAGTVNPKSAQYNAVVEATLWSLAQEDENFHVVDLSDCPLLSDNLHFDAKGCQTVASRYFNRMVKLGLVDAQPIAGCEEPSDSLSLTRSLISNYDFDLYYNADSMLVVNDGAQRKTVSAPWGWNHTWAGYPETKFPCSSNPPTYGITGSGNGKHGANVCWYMPSKAMPDDFELYQEIPAGQLTPGTYRLQCLWGASLTRAGVTRIFANDNVLYYGSLSRYDFDALSLLYPDEIANFAGLSGTSIDDMKDVSLQFCIHENEGLRFGIRSAALSVKGVASSIAGMGGFSTDFWRLVKVSDEVVDAIKSIQSTDTSAQGTFDMMGRKVASKRNLLRRGIYVQDGKKVLVR